MSTGSEIGRTPARVNRRVEPGRTGGGRVEAAHHPAREPVAALGVEHPHRIGRLLRRRRARRGPRVAQLLAERVGQLAGDPPHREAVAPVRCDRELHDHLVEPDERSGIVARRGVHIGRQHDDTRVVVAQPELAGGADHAVGEVPVRLARTDPEAAGQDSARQDHRHQSADREVRRATDDAARHGLAVLVGLTDIDQDMPDRLLELAELGDLLDPADQKWAGDGRAKIGDLLDLEADPDQGGLQLGRIGRCVDELPQPRHGHPHPSDLHSERAGEPDVTLDHVAHVRDTMAEHQRPLDAHAESESTVDIRIDAAGGEDARVHHAAATPLDPPGRRHAPEETTGPAPPTVR